MTRTDKKERIERERILYDGLTVERIVDEYGPATEIKRNVKTTATVYEIRAATWYWVFGNGRPRQDFASNASAKVYDIAKAVDEGRTEVLV